MGSTTVSGPLTSTNGFVGTVTGNVTGNLTGNVTGNVTGDVTGNLTGNVTGNVTGSVSGGAPTPVAAGGTLAVTQALHAGKLVLLDTAAGSVCTLPAASGSGAVYRFATSVLATSNSHIVKVANSTDIMVGYSVSIDDADNSMTVFPTLGTSDTITLNRTTTGSVRIGEMITLTDVKTGFWSVHMCAVGTGGEATPFSATV